MRLNKGVTKESSIQQIKKCDCQTLWILMSQNKQISDVYQAKETYTFR